jgi:chloramphenicol O-acetyltransferase type A
MRQLFDLENWPRKDHFNFFNSFEEPFFGVVVDIDCTIAYDQCKREGKGFFLYYLHQALAAANSIENFRLRIEDDQIYLYDQVHASAVINRPDGTFGFSYIDYAVQFEDFQVEAQKKYKGLNNLPDSYLQVQAPT